MTVMKKRILAMVMAGIMTVQSMAVVPASENYEFETAGDVVLDESTTGAEVLEEDAAAMPALEEADFLPDVEAVTEGAEEGLIEDAEEEEWLSVEGLIIDEDPGSNAAFPEMEEYDPLMKEEIETEAEMSIVADLEEAETQIAEVLSAAEPEEEAETQAAEVLIAAEPEEEAES